MINQLHDDWPYRDFETSDAGRVPFRVRVATTDLYIRAERDLTNEARASARKVRGEIEAHISRYPAFATSLSPLSQPDEPIPASVGSMYAAGRAAGVGPMAAVAGAIAGAVGKELRTHSREVMVENGGDVYLDLIREAAIGLFAGSSPFSGRVGIRVEPNRTPLAVCTSSGTVGPSLSYGRVDAATTLSRDPALADAVATAMGNRVQKPRDLEEALEWALSVPDIVGAIVIVDGYLAAKGEVEFVETRSRLLNDKRPKPIAALWAQGPEFR